MISIVFKLNGLDCASCANKIKVATEKQDNVLSANLDFVTSKFTVKLDSIDSEEEFINKIKEIVYTYEEDVIVEVLSVDNKENKINKLTLELDGLDCAGCAGEITDFTKDLSGVEDVNLNFVTKKMEVSIKDKNEKAKIKKDIIEKMKQLEPNVVVKEIQNNKLDKKIVLELDGLDCAGCADNIVEYTKTLENVESVDLNFVNKKMTISTNDYSKKAIIVKKIVEKMKQLEPHVEVKDLSTIERVAKNTKIILELDGLDCAGCADNIVEYTKTIKGVKEVDLNFVNKKMNIELEDIRLKNEVVDLVTEKMKQLEPHVKVNDLTSGKDKKEPKEVKSKSSSQNKDLLRIIIAGIFFAIPYALKLEGSARFISFLVSYIIVGTDVILTAIRNIKAGNAMDEHFLMTVATIGAFIIGEYPEGVAVMLFYQLGEYFQGRAVNHSRSSIKALMDIRPDYANLLIDGEVVVVDPEDIEIGDYILIRPGEKVPLDGIVVEGNSTLDTSNITGESVPRSIKEGEDLVSGVVNNQGVLKVKVTKEFGDSTIVKILDLVENASSRKAPTENFITKFSRYYTPIVVYAALAIGVIPPLLFGGQWADWAYKAFVFLVISCPCALVISIPLGFFGGIGAASKEGILIKGGNYLEALNDIDTVVFDKTGTITKGVFKVTEIKTYSDYSKEDILEIAAYGEVYSNHPIGVSIISSYDKEIDKTRIQEYEEIAGNGIKAKMGDRYFYLGNKSLLEGRSIKVNEEDSIGTVVYIAEDNKHIGTIIVSDELKDNIKESLEELNSVGIKNTIMLSGDNKETVEKVAKASGINIAYGELLPQDKVAKFEEILKNKDPKHKVAFVGDGVNDAPVLARADIGIAMGGLGSDAAIEASDIVIMTDEIHKISTGIKIANKTKRIVTQNIILALGVKFIVLALGVFGKASMWQAVFADVGVSIIAIFNSIRALKVDE